MSFATKSMTRGTRASNTARASQASHAKNANYDYANHAEYAQASNRAHFPSQSLSMHAGARDYGHAMRDFSSSGIVDYKPGISFSSMLANNQEPVMSAGSEYKVNLDNNGHTVKMNIQPAGSMHAPPVPGVLASSAGVFLSNEQIATVASRIASELCGKPAPAGQTASGLAPALPSAALALPPAALALGAGGAVGASPQTMSAAPQTDDAIPPHIVRQLKVMQRRIDALQSELHFDASRPPQPRAAGAARAPAQPELGAREQSVGRSLAPAAPRVSASEVHAHTAHLDAGLRHHTETLRATQRKIDALENEFSQMLSIATEQAATLDLMDEGLRSQKTEIEASNRTVMAHQEHVAAAQDRMVRFEGEMAGHGESVVDLERRCAASIGSLRDEYNTQKESTDTLQEHMRNVDMGLHNHKDEIRAMRGKYETHASSRAEADSQLLIARQQLAAAQSRLDEMDTGLLNHQSQIRSIKSGIQEHQDTMSAGLESQHSSMQSLQASMQKQHAQLGEGLHNHKDEIRSMRSEALLQRQSVAAAHDSQQDKMSSLQANVQQQHAQLGAGLSNHKDEIRGMRSDVQQQRHSLAAMQQVQQMSAGPLQTQLTSMQTRLDALQSTQNTLLTSSSPQQIRTATNVSRGDLQSFLQQRSAR